MFYLFVKFEEFPQVYVDEKRFVSSNLSYCVPFAHLAVWRVYADRPFKQYLKECVGLASNGGYSSSNAYRPGGLDCRFDADC